MNLVNVIDYATAYCRALYFAQAGDEPFPTSPISLGVNGASNPPKASDPGDSVAALPPADLACAEFFTAELLPRGEASRPSIPAGTSTALPRRVTPSPAAPRDRRASSEQAA